MNTKEFCDKYFVERKNTGSRKWDGLVEKFGDDDLTAMWVADMDFKTSDSVVKSLSKRVANGLFGYEMVPDSFYDAFIQWQKNVHGYEVKKEWIGFSNGVVSTMFWFVNAFSKPNDAVIVLNPVYFNFHHAVRESGRKLIPFELTNNDGFYTIDFQAFEKAIVDNHVKLFMLCSPHNPTGRIWTVDELTKLLEICKKYSVLVLSDEIHQDLEICGKHVPSATVCNGKFCDIIITTTSASKTFNLAGLIQAFVIISNEQLRAQYTKYVSTVSHVPPNIFGLCAAEAAYADGHEWLAGLLDVIRENYNYMAGEFKTHVPKIIVSPLEGTYLAWVDFRAYIPNDEMKSFIQDTCRLAIDFGEWFSESSYGFIRINLATSPEIVKSATQRVVNALLDRNK